MVEESSRDSVGEKPLAGRVAIITGGGRGLGRAMALGLAKAGAAVVATAARERHELKGLADEAAITDTTNILYTLVADVTREEDCARTVALTLERFGRLDILVNNAGRGMKRKFHDPANALLGDAGRYLAFCDRNERCRAFPNGARSSAHDALRRLGAYHQRFD